MTANSASSRTTQSAVYVLVSDERDHYLEMLYLSASSMHRYSPSLKVCLVTDAATAEVLNQVPRCRSVLDEVIVVDDPELIPLGKVDRSRFIKTSLPRYVSGDFLYIDIDAFPVGNLAPLFKIQQSVSMTYDQNVPPEKFLFEDYEKEIFKKMNWPLPPVYFNGGVILVKGNDPKATQFFEDWHALWQQTRLTGNHKDQPALHETIRRKSYAIGLLPKEANLLVSLKPRCFWGKPMVYHISTIRFEERSDTFYHGLVKSLKMGGSIDFNAIDQMAASRYPWSDPHQFWHAYYTRQFHRLPAIAARKALRLLRRSK